MAGHVGLYISIVPTQSMGTIGSRGAVKIVPHAPRGNAARDAPRPKEPNAERP
ncbi:hypothetical protein AK973_4336 [Pseudomonas brassicacearum]|nr:hypothetical protein AK973_4336 [Pseudomonas brassicacearum]